MQVFTKIIVDIGTDTVLERQGYEYQGPVAECISFGGQGQKSKQKSEQKSHSESGTRFNQDFLRNASAWANNELPLYNGSTLNNTPDYNPNFVRVAPEGFQKLEDTLYEGQRSKLATAYSDAVGRQREELAQMGALNSPSQFLEGSARSGLDRRYLEGLQQAARDAFAGRMGLEEREAGRETQFNEQTAARLVDLWLKKLAAAIESGRYSQGDSQGGSSGSSSGGGGQFSIFKLSGD